MQMRVRRTAPAATHGQSANPGQTATAPSRICGECGEQGRPECTYCQECGHLLPDPALGTVVTYSTDTGGRTNPTHKWIWLSATLAVLLTILTAAWWTVQRVTEPQPQEILAATSFTKAQAILTEIRESKNLAQLRETAADGEAALAPIEEMLLEISSDNDTRPRLDSYRSLFRGIALLSHVTEDQLAEWSGANQAIQAGMNGLADDDPMGGALRSRGVAATDAIQDQIDALERADRAKQSAESDRRASGR